MLNFKFHQNRRIFFFSLRRVPPLKFSIVYLKSVFLAIESSELPWQMVFSMNSECPNIYLPRKINRSHGIFCFIKKSYSTLCIFTTRKYPVRGYLLAPPGRRKRIMRREDITLSDWHSFLAEPVKTHLCGTSVKNKTKNLILFVSFVFCSSVKFQNI